MEKSSKKSKSVQPVPEGFHTVTPYLVVDRAKQFIDFLAKAFDAELTFLQKTDDNQVMHATVKIGNSIIMVSDAMGMPHENAMLYLYVDDVDKLYKQALSAKATTMHEPMDQFYGDRAGAVKDEWGNKWWISTHIEDVSPEELKRRGKKAEEERKQKEPAHA